MLQLRRLRSVQRIFVVPLHFVWSVVWRMFVVLRRSYQQLHRFKRLQFVWSVVRRMFVVLRRSNQQLRRFKRLLVVRGRRRSIARPCGYEPITVNSSGNADSRAGHAWRAGCGAEFKRDSANLCPAYRIGPARPRRAGRVRYKRQFHRRPQLPTADERR